MSQTTPLLGLPYLDAAQAQKHVIHNEALRLLDAVVQLAVADRDLGAPPAEPANGDRYIVAAGAGGAWAGRAGQVAAWQDGAWAFFAPAPGWLAWVADEAVLVAWNGEAWVIAGGSGGGSGVDDIVDMLGINDEADETNRLVVASAASLFNHVGAGHQHKINKAAAGDTASVLFQTNYSGRAEVGTASDDKLHLKMSADGAAWTEAMVVDGTGKILVGHNTSVNVGSAGAQTVSMQVHGTDAGTAQAGVYRWSDDNGGSTFSVVKSRGVSKGTRGLVAQDDVIGLFTFYGDDGANFPVAAAIRVAVDGMPGVNDMPGRIMFFTTPDGSAGSVERLRVNSGGHTLPGADNAYTLGQSGARWSAVWAANGTIQISDARDKDVIGGLGFAGALVDAVDPVLFRWKVGGNVVRPSETEATRDESGSEEPTFETVPHPGARAHAGFLAQDIKAAMDGAGVDFGAWGLEDKDDPTSRQFMRPDQLVAVLWAALKETRGEVEAMRAQLPLPK